MLFCVERQERGRERRRGNRNRATGKGSKAGTSVGKQAGESGGSYEARVRERRELGPGALGVFAITS
jgi:hypothetical protein